jgi:hypothetical protein
LLDNHPRIRALRSQLAISTADLCNEAQKLMKGPDDPGADSRFPESQLIADVYVEGCVGTRRREQVELDALRAKLPPGVVQLERTTIYLAASRVGPQLSAGRCPVFGGGVPPEPYFPRT